MYFYAILICADKIFFLIIYFHLTANVDETVIKISETFMKTLNKHAPYRCLFCREKKLNEKPEITRGILKSIKTKTSC